jgi:hypothetical protein
VKTFFRPTTGDWYGNPLGAVKRVERRQQLTEPLGEDRIAAQARRPLSDHRSARREQLHRLETRLFIHTPRRWRGHTYV